jgi:hypothetical protein
MWNSQHTHLVAPGAQWFASVSMFCTGTVAPAAVAMRNVRAAKIDPAPSGGPVRGGNP